MEGKIDDIPAEAMDSKEDPSTEEVPVVEITNLDFQFRPSDPIVLHDMSFKIPAGSRCLLIGDNGAGKSTLMRVIAGKHIHKEGAVKVFGRSSFYDTGLNLKRNLLCTDWGRRTVAFAGYGMPLQADIRVKAMMKDDQAAYPERREMLIKLLQVNPEWRMHQLSDGQRRRVQIFLQLLVPYPLILLDEITTDLDCLTRKAFLEFLKQETKRGATVIYATHIFGGLTHWWDRIIYLYKGEMRCFSHRDDLEEFKALCAGEDPEPLLSLIESWISRDRATDPDLKAYAVV